MNVFSMHTCTRFASTQSCSDFMGDRKTECLLPLPVYVPPKSMWRIIYAQHLTSFFIFPSVLWRARSKFFHIQFSYKHINHFRQQQHLSDAVALELQNIYTVCAHLYIAAVYGNIQRPKKRRFYALSASVCALVSIWNDPLDGRFT